VDFCGVGVGALVGCNPMVDDEAVEHGAPGLGTDVGTGLGTDFGIDVGIDVGSGVGSGISVMGASSPSWWS
jgi:hypothetical protein